jgi:hypothetical protein
MLEAKSNVNLNHIFFNLFIMFYLCETFKMKILFVDVRLSSQIQIEDRGNVPRKHGLIFNRLYGVISKKAVYFMVKSVLPVLKYYTMRVCRQTCMLMTSYFISRNEGSLHFH